MKNSRLFGAFMEHRLRRNEQKRFLSDADAQLKSCNLHFKDEIRNRYIRDLKKYMFTFDEWFWQYELYSQSEIIKKSYISISDAQRAYRAIINPEWRNIFHDKRVFAIVFQRFIKHRVLVVTPPYDIYR